MMHSLRISGPMRGRQSIIASAETDKPKAKHADPSKRLGIRISLFTYYSSLPSAGRMISLKDETCDPYNSSSCQTLSYVYEEKCHACYGTGFAKTQGKQKKSLAVCVSCLGLGVVRCTTTEMPDLSKEELIVLRDDPPLNVKKAPLK